MGNQSSDQGGATAFFRDVARYFMDFLETDFHKHRVPRRAISTRNSDNLLVGVNLAKYETFRKLLTKSLRDGLPGDVPIEVRQGEYRTKLPPRIAELVQLQISKVNAADVSSVLERTSDELRNESLLNAKQLDVAAIELSERVGTILYERLVHPFITSITNPLHNGELGDEQNIFQIEQELTSVLLELVDAKLMEILVRTFAGEKISASNELSPYFDLPTVQVTLSTFFASLQIADLYLELAELERNRSIFEKHEFYLYIGDIGFQGIRYPIFFIPLQVEKAQDSFKFLFDSQLYFNKKALGYVAQQVNDANETHGALNGISERIIYTAAYGKELLPLLQNIVSAITTHFELPRLLNLDDFENDSAQSSEVKLSNSTYFALFDKSDEALVNDYEEILQELALDGGSLSEAFNRILADFLQKNPEPIGPIVEQLWDDLSTSEKLVATSPIPLNSEQLQILSAVHQDACKYLIVEGPPGTGKSHTITAIVFDAVLSGQSVLVLSDKKEALDVVEKNITEAINKVRFDRNFQNPILRLGKTGSTYSQILSKSSMNEIKTHHRAFRQEISFIKDEISGLEEQLKEDIELEILANQDLDMGEIQEFVDLEQQLDEAEIIFDLPEVLADPDGPIAMGELRARLQNVFAIRQSSEIRFLVKIFGYEPGSLHEILELIRLLNALQEIASQARQKFGDKTESLHLFKSIKQQDLSAISRRLCEYANARNSLFGTMFHKKKIRELDTKSNDEFSLNCVALSQEVQSLNSAMRVLGFIKTESEQISPEINFKADLIAIVHLLLTDPKSQTIVQKLATSLEEFDLIIELINQFPKSVSRMNLDRQNLDSASESLLFSTSEVDFERYVRYAQLRQRLNDGFANIPEINYQTQKQKIENLVTARVAHLLDSQVINFYEGSKNDAEMLRNVIKGKQKFPRTQFDQLRIAFPCILAGIRDFAEYIPLENATFDLLIIDEASQVSLAQAFPALLRAKKVLILGDRKQFSNVKAAQARSDTNREYLYGLDRSFRQNISTDIAQLTRLGKFNIKTSVLEFFEFISNYNLQLVKHFRGYKEIISYSNKFFYKNSLQVMKIRAKNIDDVIKFTYVEASPDDEIYQNTNLQEVRFVINELLKMIDRGDMSSVGIITPHTNQQKLFAEQLSKLPEYQRLLDDNKLKVMTFDTCQGEERDVIFYSMVATRHSDKLWGIFIKDLASVDIEEDGQIKAQRLNVGFSRGKEQLHFVLSKPLDEFSGSIGEALRHFANELEQAKKERSVIEVDPNSPMEAEVLHWFYQTDFWNENQNRITFVPQFEIGKYLKQLDVTYSHPAYKVDFLVAFNDPVAGERKIIMEYDGFYEHFKNSNLVNALNYKSYLSEDDIYRQKVLEGYGYRFLRINKFNAGENPVVTLDRRLNELVGTGISGNSLLFKIHDTIDGLHSGDMKECPKCKELRNVDDFNDSALPSGRGRICQTCKSTKSSSKRKGAYATSGDFSSSTRTCPKCGSAMIRRSGRYGTFYGCTRYPYCRGTR